MEGAGYAANQPREKSIIEGSISISINSSNNPWGGGQLVGNGRFEVFERIDAGSFKTVWVARDTMRRQIVALSILNQVFTADDAEARFQKETHILDQLTKDLPDDLMPFKKRIITLIDVGTLDDEPPFRGPFMTTPLKRGVSLKDMCKSRGALPWREAVGIGIGIMEALQVCHMPTRHRGPIIHRDLKPANIIIGPKDEVTVLDFGVSKMVTDATRPEQSAVVGTVRYMAPEQFEVHSTLGPHTDLYAAGVILHQLVTGELPWASKNLRQIVKTMNDRKRGKEPPLRHLEATHLPEGLTRLIRDLLAFDPQDRPVSALRVRDRLASVCSTEHTWMKPQVIPINVENLVLSPVEMVSAPLEMTSVSTSVLDISPTRKLDIQASPLARPSRPVAIQVTQPLASSKWSHRSKKTFSLLMTAALGLFAGWVWPDPAPTFESSMPAPASVKKTAMQAPKLRRVLETSPAWASIPDSQDVEAGFASTSVVSSTPTARLIPEMSGIHIRQPARRSVTVVPPGFVDVELN